VHKCVACQYYDRNEAEPEEHGVRWGQCRRTGPIVHPLSAKAYMIEGVWPHVRDDDWCGEWAAGNRRPDSAAAAAMSSLMMQSAATAARPASPTPMFVATEPSSEPVHPPISTLLRTQTGSD
jgi:hypothetical protein